MSIVRNFADGMLNLVANLGTRRDKSAHTEYIFTPLSSHDLLSVYRSSWLTKRGIDTPAHDSVRNWRNWRAEAEQISKIEAVETAIELKKKVLEALIASRLYGGSAIYINTGSSSPATPLAATEQVRSLIVLTKDALTSDQINKDIDSEYYGKPETYKIQSNGSPVTIHASRFVIFNGEYVPADVSSQNGWGDSVLQSVIDAVKSADSTVANIASLVFEAKVDVMKVEGFADLLERHQDDLILRRAVLQAAMKGNNGMLMIDSKDDYQQKTLSFSGMPEVINKFQEWVAGAFKIPVTRLFGRSSAGLSGSGDGDERVYYDGIAQDQRLVIGPALHNLDEIIINQALGTRPAEIWYEWAPLRQMTESERADIFSKTANAARSIAGANAGEIIPLDALSDALVNALTEMGALPGLEASVEEYGSLSEQYGFIGGEQAPESFGDAAPMPLYVSRKVINADDIRKHYADQGVDNLIDADDMHVTITYSRKPVNWMKMGAAWNSRLTVEEGGPRLSEAFGPSNDTAVLTFVSRDLSWRHDDMIEQGASWDWPEYQPHITIAYDFTGQIDQVKPWTGEIVLGPEIFSRIDE